MTRESGFDRIQFAPRWVFLFLGGNLLVHLFLLYVWNAAGQVVSIQGTTDSTNAFSVTIMAGLALWLHFVVIRSFPSGSPLRSTWCWLTVAAAAATAAGLFGQFLGSDWLLNPLTWTARPRTGLIGQIRLTALIAGGPLRLIVLAAAMRPLLRTLRRFHFQARPNAIEWIVPGIFCLFTAGRLVETGSGWLGSHPVRTEDCVALAGLPVLCLLFFQGVLLRKSLSRMGTGLIARGWIALECAILASGAGEIILWVIPHFWPAPPAAISTLIHLPITAAFALVPALTLAAQHRAMQSAAQHPENLPTGIPALAR